MSEQPPEVPELEPLNELPGWTNLHSELMRRIQMRDPEPGLYVSALKSDKVIRKHKKDTVAHPVSSQVLKAAAQIRFLDERISTLQKELSREDDLDLRKKILVLLDEYAHQCKLTIEIYFLLLHHELKEWKGAKIITLRKGGIPVITTCNRDLYDKRAEQPFSMEDSFTFFANLARSPVEH